MFRQHHSLLLAIALAVCGCAGAVDSAGSDPSSPQVGTAAEALRVGYGRPPVVIDPPAAACAESADCAAGEYCTAENGVCNPAPGCGGSGDPSDMCNPEGMLCSVTTEGQDDTCCDGSCQAFACTNGFPGICFGTCAGSGGSDPRVCPALCYGTCEPRPAPPPAGVTTCLSSADCSPSEICSTETQGCEPPPCGPWELCPTTAVCAGFCIDNSR